MELGTSRLRIDALHLEDADALFRYRADPQVARYQGWRPDSLADALGFIGIQVGLASPSPGCWFQRAIRLRDDGLLIGDLGLHLSEGRQVEFGISVSPAHQGQGYAREAMAAVLAYVFGRLHAHRVHASVDPRNLASMALLRALGLRQEAHFRECLRIRGEWVDDVVFALLASEWQGARPEGASSSASR
ncbi:GNAT family N-acetyltransferase [Dyella humicola]|uniref:GNAT family N-acetyltransferase n=1 Tax=Dyella humicola TaxID=2992126 RepID=UPI002258E775